MAFSTPRNTKQTIARKPSMVHRSYLGHVVIDFFHLEDLIVGYARLGQQHVQLARHATYSTQTVKHTIQTVHATS